MQAIDRQPCTGQRAPAGAPVHYERHCPEQTTQYRLVQQHAATFFEPAEVAAGADLPQFVKDEFDAFLECGILAHGFLSLRCSDCGHDKLVAFSCKRRGFCPLCGARRMAQTAAHLVNHALALPPGRSLGTNSPPDRLYPGSLPHVPVRQWVLSLPILLRLLPAAQPKLVTPVLQVVHRVITRHLLGQAGLQADQGCRLTLETCLDWRQNQRTPAGTCPSVRAEALDLTMSLVKSKQRVADHGEVFTPAWMVEAMLDLVKNESERIDSRFLEPACGSGNFLVQVLRRKLAAVELKYGRSDFERRQFALMGLMCIYGIELLPDNIVECRANLLEIFASYLRVDAAADIYRAGHHVLSLNLVHGDALTMKDSRGAPITFAEWGYLGKGRFQRRDFRLDVLTASSAHSAGGSLFAQQDIFTPAKTWPTMTVADLAGASLPAAPVLAPEVHS